MENRIALLGIVVEQESSVEPLNRLLSEYKDYIIGRMGIPYRQRGVNLISVVLDAPGDAISSLSGKIGMLPGVSAKTLYATLPYRQRSLQPSSREETRKPPGCFLKRPLPSGKKFMVKVFIFEDLSSSQITAKMTAITAASAAPTETPSAIG